MNHKQYAAKHSMIIIENTLVSEDIFEEQFICNLYACKGACCVEGDAGAPITPEEVAVLEAELENIKPFLNPNFVKDIEANGISVIDKDGDLGTTCQKTGECNFVTRNKEGILQCGIEQAFFAEKTSFRKPLSCHLYPIRVTQVGDYQALNYNRWHICNADCSLGKQEEVTVFEFLKQPLLRAFGQAWLNEAELVFEALKHEKLG